MQDLQLCGSFCFVSDILSVYIMVLKRTLFNLTALFFCINKKTKTWNPNVLFGNLHDNLFSHWYFMTFPNFTRQASIKLLTYFRILLQKMMDYFCLGSVRLRLYNVVKYNSWLWLLFCNKKKIPNTVSLKDFYKELFPTLINEGMRWTK